jgi:hypothetical protein
LEHGRVASDSVKESALPNNLNQSVSN